MPTTLYIKNMVCPRCVKVVRDELTRLGLDVRSVGLGEVVIGGNGRLPAISPTMMAKVRGALEANGFEIVEDRRAKTIEKIKHAALKLARNDYGKTPIRVKDSEFIAKEVGDDYRRLSDLFSEVESVTIEHYLILQKIEHVKELLKYGELTLSEIAFRMGYSSVAHVSSQFKNVTGMTPSEFKARGLHRHPVDSVGRSHRANSLPR